MEHQFGYYVAEWRMKKEYFIQRKAWARTVITRAGLKDPGDTTTDEFEGRTYTITIGPRRGIQIRGDLPWQTNWRWFREMREKGISRMPVEDWFTS